MSKRWKFDPKPVLKKIIAKAHFDCMRQQEADADAEITPFHRAIMNGAPSDNCDNCLIPVVLVGNEWVDDFGGPECAEYNSSGFDPAYRFHVVEAA